MQVLACPKCKGRALETTTNFVDVFTQCTSCGHIIDLVEQHNARAVVKDQEDEIDEISRRLASIKDDLAVVPDKLE